MEGRSADEPYTSMKLGFQNVKVYLRVHRIEMKKRRNACEKVKVVRENNEALRSF